MLQNGSPVVGASISGGSLGNRTTDANGRFSFDNVPALTSYRVSAAARGYSIVDAVRTGILSADAAVDFAASPNAVAISGQVTLGGSPLSGVLIDGGPLGLRTTGANGSFSYNGIKTGTQYSLRASKDGFTFGPELQQGTASDNVSANFEGSGRVYTVSGTVKLGNVGMADVSLISSELGTVTTDSRGYFSFANVVYGTRYTISARLPGYTFSPLSVRGTALGNQTHTFKGQAQRMTVSGTVLSSRGSALARATVTCGKLKAVTGKNGKYIITSTYGSSFSCRAAKSGLDFGAPVPISVNANIPLSFRAR